MIFSETANSDQDARSAIQSLQDWWKLAGVDVDYDPVPSSLLDKKVMQSEVMASEKPRTLNSPRTAQPVTEKQVAKTPPKDFPSDYGDFQSWLRLPINLAEADWARDFVFPDGDSNPEIMVISSMPEAGALGSSQLYSGNETKLLRNMLAAVGIDWNGSYRASLSFGRTIDGRLSDEQMEMLVPRTLHLISLVQPKRIIIFGNTASRAFFKQEMLTARKKKQFINHVSSKTEAIVTFHPRILLERPELKAEAWKDLQMLTRIVNP